MGEGMDFTAKLSALCAQELSASHRDADKMGVMIERLAASLGFAIAVAARGNAQAIDELLAGAEGYAHAEAVSKSRLVKLIFRHKPDA